MKTQPLTMLLAMMAGWLNRHQQQAIEYLKAENSILRDELLKATGKKRILLNDSQKRRLATLGRGLGKKLLGEICTVFSPATIMKWHFKLVAMKYDGTQHRKKYGRPQITDELRNLIIKLAKANRDWGSIRIQGQLKYLGYKVCPKTISTILKKHGLEPDPDRKRQTTWNDFVKSHMQSLAAIDFFSAEIYTFRGLTRYMVLTVIDYATRKVEIAGIIEQANGQWMKQMAKNLTDPIDGFLKDKKYLIHDRDTLFTKEFRQILKSAGIKPLRTPPLSPNLTPFIERFVRSIKYECLYRMLIFGERHLEYLVFEFVQHYHGERAHQGLDNEIIEPPPQGEGEIVCHERLGGLLKFYRRAA
jgi:putative transposase